MIKLTAGIYVAAVVCFAGEPAAAIPLSAVPTDQAIKNGRLVCDDLGGVGRQDQPTDRTILITDIATRLRPNGNGRAFALLVRRRRATVKNALK